MNLNEKAYKIRKDIVTLIHNAGCGHIGGDLSVTDALVTLYYKHLNCSPSNTTDPNRDRFVLSKGHCVEALYCVLADLNFFDSSELNNYSAYKSNFIGHPNNKINGIEMNSGSLGHGLSVSVGMALAGKMDKKDYRVYTIMGDGELAEGSVWEGAMSASHYNLDNLTAFIDRNGLQISGTTEEVMSQNNLEDRWSSFGWNVLSIDGNNTEEIDKAIDTAKNYKGKPTLIILNTTKGCGVSFMENNKSWHHKVPNAQEFTDAMTELEKRRASYE